MKKYSVLLTLFICMICGTALAERLSVTAPMANIRSGPGTTHDIMWKVEKYHPLFIIKKAGKWYYFKDFEGDMGWVHESLVGKIHTVITVKEQCNVRSGPGTNFEIEFAVERAVPFKVLKQKGN